MHGNHIVSRQGPPDPLQLELTHRLDHHGILDSLALVMATADATGRTKREQILKANPFLEHFTVADLKVWADRKMRGPELQMAKAFAADGKK
jgi:hypothetical protein